MSDEPTSPRRLAVHLFHFGPPAAPLAGLFEPALPPRRNRPVLLLHAGGWEYLRSYRTMRQLSSRLAAAGCDVLRFDYTGTGDSWGATVPRPVDAWLDDIRYAAEELEALAGGSPAVCIGLRLGARLALEATVRGVMDAERLLLWDPVGGAGPFDGGLSGDRADAALALRAALDGTLVGASDQQVASLLQGTRVACLLSAGVALPDDLKAGGSAIAPMATGEPPCWREERTWGAGALPVRGLDRIVEWCTA